MAAPPSDGSSFTVIYADSTMVVLNKPPNVAMDTPKGMDPMERGTVESWAWEYMKTNGLYDARQAAQQQAGHRRKQLKFVHQLDYATSGVLCLAFTKARAAALAHQFEMRACEKWYLAVLEGHVSRVNANRAAVQAVWVEPRGRGDPTSDGVQGDAAVAGAFLRSCGAGTLAELCPSVASWSPSDSAAHEEASTAGSRFLHVVEQTDAADAGGATAALTSFHKIIASLLSAESYYDIILPIGKDASDPDGFRMGIPGLNNVYSLVGAGKGSPAAVHEGGGVVDARYASTHVHILEEFHMDHPVTKKRVPVTKVLLRPKAGRRHQLRVHCALGLGCPILGDVTYGGDGVNTNGDRTGAAGWLRMYLHAWRLAFPDNVMEVEPLTEKERVERKKKRKREVKGIAEKDSSSDVTCWTVFQSSDPFFHNENKPT